MIRIGSRCSDSVRAATRLKLQKYVLPYGVSDATPCRMRGYRVGVFFRYFKL